MICVRCDRVDDLNELLIQAPISTSKIESANSCFGPLIGFKLTDDELKTLIEVLASSLDKPDDCAEASVLPLDEAGEGDVVTFRHNDRKWQGVIDVNYKQSVIDMNCKQSDRRMITLERVVESEDESHKFYYRDATLVLGRDGDWTLYDFDSCHKLDVSSVRAWRVS